MMKIILFKICVVFLIAVLVLPALTSAVARADNGQQDREVSIQTSDNGYFQIVSKLPGQPGNQFDLQFAENTLLMTFSNGSDQQNASLEFAITLDKLIYTNGTGSNSTLISFEDAGFTLMSGTMLAPYVSTFSRSVFGVISEAKGTVFIMIIQVNGKPVQVMSPVVNKPVELYPNQVKISFIIQNAGMPQIQSGTYMNQQPPNMFTAGNISLLMTLSSPSGFPVLYQSASSVQLNFTEENSTGYFEWSRSAYVYSSLTQSVSERNVLFSLDKSRLTLVYPAAQRIVHDPVIGISPQSLIGGVVNAVKTAGNIIIYSIALTLAAVLVAGSVLYRRKH
ncbi:MAG: hypothetical protein KIY12_01300 [Thermoplasmata archaeon]|uniref:Uncharacterized protein n=1 Tax=Candidatus Sysuiplasma superficiale TaxID=2823368 RepID=A0A8J7YP94_9ARCH|nr:hypothetical protein [Candidatus Sysuiplasma superficiale]MBX8643356.1 hypothetical protein [Candidatus Sysuiplasma superficiale]MCL4347215.1 hypothetical protein [Candidatus Thermoplasmatota archaeon]